MVERSSDEKRSWLLAAWQTFIEKITGIRARQRTLLSDYDRSLTEREVEVIRQKIREP